jgi:hypothetical protein
MADISPAMRAELDRQLEAAAQVVLERAAEYDGVDLIEANVDLTNYLLGLGMTVRQLATGVAVLALRLHRSGGR